MGATQPIGVILHPESPKSTQLCGFAIFPTVFTILHGTNLLASPLLPPTDPTPSIYPIVVWMGGLPGLDMLSQNKRKMVLHDTIP
jgi:hypothetical protein